MYNFSEWIADFELIADGHRLAMNSAAFNGNDLLEGRWIDDWDYHMNSISVRYGEPLSVDFQHPRNRWWPIFSEAMREFFDKSYPTAFQFLPFPYSSKPNEKTENKKLYLGNCLHLVDSIDEKTIDLSSGCSESILRVRSLEKERPFHVYYDQVKDFPVFRIKRLPIKLYVRNDVKENILSSGFTGSIFLKG